MKIEKYLVNHLTENLNMRRRPHENIITLRKYLLFPLDNLKTKKVNQLDGNEETLISGFKEF